MNFFFRISKFLSITVNGWIILSFFHLKNPQISHLSQHQLFLSHYIVWKILQGMEENCKFFDRVCSVTENKSVASDYWEQIGLN